LPISSDQDVRNATPGAHTVAGARGLILRVHAAADGSLTRSWFVRINIDGRRRPRGLGGYPLVKLAKARELASEAHRSIAEGIDPGLTAKRRQQAAEEAKRLRFGKAVDDFFAKAARPFANPRSDEIRERALRVHFERWRDKEVAAITTEDLAGVLKSLRPETASRAYSAFNEVFGYAEVVLRPLGVTIHNPANPRSLAALGWKRKSSKAAVPHPAVHWTMMPEVVSEISQLPGVDAACALFAIATAVRCGTARKARWKNIDLEKRTWTIPLEDLKGREHNKKTPPVVPLSNLAIKALEMARGRSASPLYVFGNSIGHPITDQNLTHLTRRLRRRHDDWRDPHTDKPFTLHGMRASFKTWTREAKLEPKLFGYIPPREVAELVLGHKVGGDVERAYDRSSPIEALRAMLDLWSAHCLGGEILSFPARA
jgi:integrase